MSEDTEKRTDLLITGDLRPVLGVLKEEDAQAIVALKEELADTWKKKQIFRTETEMRVSVLNDAKHPTPASKYWQSVREMSAMFDSLVGLSFELRRAEVTRLKLEQRMQKAIEDNDTLEQMEIQIDLDQNFVSRANMEQIAHDRVRELNLWSRIKAELTDGTFDTENVNTHQAESLQLTLQNRVQALNPGVGPAEVVNALGPLRTLERLKNEEGKLLSFSEAKQKLLQNQTNQ